MASAVRMMLDPHQRSPQATALFELLRHRVVGQEPALERMVDTYQTLLAGLCSRQRPLANFLFLGPTGSGKTLAVEALAEALFHDPKALIKVDCAEFQHGHEIAKLVGSPPGYLGHRETHPVLTQEALEQHQTPEAPVSLVLFDEIEKASDALWQLLLGILDKATLTLGDNRKVDFSRAMIFLTSNLGANEMEGLLRPGFGFAPGAAGAESTGVHRRLHDTAVAAARRKFSPEFFNRLDHVVVFQPLTAAQMDRVLDLELEAVTSRIAARAGTQGRLEFRCTEPARDLLLQEGVDAKYGARPLKRAIERLLVVPLANLIATGQVGAAPGAVERIAVDAEGGGLVFTRVNARSH